MWRYAVTNGMQLSPLFSRPPMDNLVVTFRFASLTGPAGPVDNRQADSQVAHRLPATLAYGLTRCACLIFLKIPQRKQPCFEACRSRSLARIPAQRAYACYIGVGERGGRLGKTSP